MLIRKLCLYWEKQDPWESAFLPNPQAVPVLLTWECFLSVDDVEPKGRERTVLALQWEEGIIVLIGSGLLVAALARLPGRRLAGSLQSGKSPTGPGSSRLPLGHRGPGAAPGSSPPQPVAVWLSCSSRALPQTEFPEPAISSLLRIHAVFSHSSNSGCYMVFLSTAPAVHLWVLF